MEECSKRGAPATGQNRSVPLPGLKGARRRTGLTQRELARLAGCGQGTVAELETSRRGAYPRTIRKLASALGMLPSDLVHGRPLE